MDEITETIEDICPLALPLPSPELEGPQLQEEPSALQMAVRRFQEASKVEIEKIKRHGVLDDKALNRIVERLRSSPRKGFKIRKEDVGFVKKISGFDRHGAIRVLVIREEILKSQQKGLEMAEAINELVHRLGKSRITGRKRERYLEKNTRPRKKRKLKQKLKNKIQKGAKVGKKSRKRTREQVEKNPHPKKYPHHYTGVHLGTHSSRKNVAPGTDTTSDNDDKSYVRKSKRTKIEHNNQNYNDKTNQPTLNDQKANPLLENNNLNNDDHFKSDIQADQYSKDIHVDDKTKPAKTHVPQLKKKMVTSKSNKPVSSVKKTEKGFSMVEKSSTEDDIKNHADMADFPAVEDDYEQYPAFFQTMVSSLPLLLEEDNTTKLTTHTQTPPVHSPTNTLLTVLHDVELPIHSLNTQTSTTLHHKPPFMPEIKINTNVPLNPNNNTTGTNNTNNNTSIISTLVSHPSASVNNNNNTTAQSKAVRKKRARADIQPEETERSVKKQKNTTASPLFRDPHQTK